MEHKSAVTGGMRVKTYVVLERALEEGFRVGWNRAHKHTDTPRQDVIESEVIRAIQNAIDEVFVFPDDYNGA